jgi:hypothetical protein
MVAFGRVTLAAAGGFLSTFSTHSHHCGYLFLLFDTGMPKRVDVIQTADEDR